MAYSPISAFPIQYSKLDGAPANGYYLKFYVANSTTPISMQTDTSGATSLAKCKLNESGYPISNPDDENTIFIPHLNTSYEAYRFVLYENAADADANGTDGLPNLNSIQTPWDSARDFINGVISSDDIPFIQSGTGAVATTVQTKLREIEVSVTDFGAVGDGVTDDTAAIQAALDSGALSVKIPKPSVSYRISAINVPANMEIETDGYATVLHQLSGTAVGTRMININGSNVTIGSLTCKGNISTDTSEQNHAVFIQSNATNGNLENITVADIHGENVRGDVLYVGATTGYLTTQLKFGRITGDNILRNVVSLVGCAYVNGDACVSTGPTGLYALDIEPNTVTCHDINIGYVYGAGFGVLPPLAANAAYNINVEMADLDPAYAPNSTPSYSFRFDRSAVGLRNIKSINIGQLKVNGHSHFAVEYIYNAGEQRGEGIKIGHLEATNIGASETTYNTLILAPGINNITIDSVVATFNSVSDSLIQGDSSASALTKCIINKASIDGRVARYINKGRFSNIIIDSVAATSAFMNCYDCTILDSDITLPTLINFSSRCVFINTIADCSTAYYGSTVADTTRINCVWGGVTTGFVTQRQADTVLTGEIAYGSTTATTVGAAGAASALPANPTGYIVINVAGTARKIPFYAN